MQTENAILSRYTSLEQIYAYRRGPNVEWVHYPVFDDNAENENNWLDELTEWSGKTVPELATFLDDSFMKSSIRWRKGYGVLTERLIVLVQITWISVRLNSK